jgi:hypothetical protein
MLFSIRKYLAIGTLLVFLFPLIAEDVHRVEHANDSHCSSLEHHIHQQEHHCGICDYAPSVFESFIISLPTFKADERHIHYSFFYQTVALFTLLKGSSLRAPPISSPSIVLGFYSLKA